MANILQVTWEWDGFPGAPGYTNLYYASTAGTPQEALDAASKSAQLFAGLASLLPNDVHIRLLPDCRLIDDATGDLQNIFTVVGPAQVNGSGGVGNYAAPTGGAIDWLTGVVHGKHLMVGRTFVVPMIGSTFTAGGQVNPGTVTQLGTAAEGMRNYPGPQFGIWGRPRPAKTVGGVVVPALVGAWHPAISSRSLAKAVVLRSRRD